MESILKILNKPVVSMLECKNEGIVKDICLTKNLSKIKWLLIEDDKKKKLLKPSNIYSFMDVVTVKQTSFLIDFDLSPNDFVANLPLNALALLSSGKVLSKVSDIYFDEKFNIVKIELENNEELDKTRIIKFNNEHVILRNENEKLKLVEKKIKIENDKKYKEIKVEIQDNITPSTLLCNYKYLLKKRLRFDLAFNDGTIYKRGSIVTEGLIKKAGRENKIKRLLISTLGNIDFF